MTEKEEEEGPHTIAREMAAVSRLAQKAMDRTPGILEQTVPEEHRRHVKKIQQRGIVAISTERTWDHAKRTGS